ncbi:MAG: hypothetical protein KDK63_05100, partial [Chlamydiia bacterium]|nr:hypothetical protein [Chlamydiia bacterium]
MTLKLPTIAKPNVVSSAGVGNFDPVGTLVNLCFYYLGPEKPPTFDPYECTVLTHQVEEDVATKYIQKEFEPRYTFVDKKIEQLTEESSLGEMVHMLYILSIMEKGALEWKDKHTVSNIATPRAVHLLYTKLFDKIETAFPPQTNNLRLEQITCSLPKLAGNDDAHSSLNAALQMLFSNYELAKDLVYSTNQNAHLRHAFALFQKAAQGYLKAPIDLATTLYPFYSSTQEKESSADLISKMLAPLPDNSELLHELAINSGENGVQYVKQAVCTLDIKDETNQSLEILLFTSFNQILDEDGTSAIQTRFVSAPKFLFFNLNREGVSDKGSALSGVQRTFFFLSELVRDQKGASYSLQSFNVQKGNRYIHYREASAKFYRFEDDHVEEITELEYLAEAQKAYVMIFQRGVDSLHPLMLHQGMEENAARFQSMQLIHFAIHALRGGKMKPEYPLLKPLQQFMESLLGSTPNKEAFETLDEPLQNAVLFLWSKTQLLDDMISYLDDQKKSPQLLCYSEFDPYLYGNSARLVTMIDLFAQKIHAYPLREEDDALLAIITATSAISNNLQDSAVIRTSITREVGQLALSSAVFTVTCWKGGKEINLKSLVASSAFLMQCLSSTKNVLFTYFDPRNQNKKLQFIERHVQPLTQVGRALLTPYFMPNCDPAKWKDALPLVSPLIQDAFSLGNYYLQRPII